MVRLARNCGTVGVSSTGTGDRVRITVAMTRAARKAGINRAAREITNSRTVFLRSIVIRITKPLMMKNSSTPKWPGPRSTDSGMRPG